MKLIVGYIENEMASQISVIFLTLVREKLRGYFRGTETCKVITKTEVIYDFEMSCTIQNGTLLQQ